MGQTRQKIPRRNQGSGYTLSNQFTIPDLVGNTNNNHFIDCKFFHGASLNFDSNCIPLPLTGQLAFDEIGAECCLP